MAGTLILKFKIYNNLRFLSHRQSLTLFQRALVRSGIEICYSQGFNPRPKLSLPLPRSVGVQSDDELLYVSVVADESNCDFAHLSDKIQKQLPQGCEITGGELAEHKKNYRALSAVYEFPLAGVGCDETVTATAESLSQTLQEGTDVFVERRTDAKGRCVKKNIAQYIDSIVCSQDTVLVNCRITQSGTVRIEELLELLRIDLRRLSGPVKRKSVQWQSN